jgi:hypothetical protein
MEISFSTLHSNVIAFSVKIILLIKFSQVKYKTAFTSHRTTFHQHRFKNLKCRFVRVKFCLVVHKGIARALWTPATGYLTRCIALLLAFILPKMVGIVEDLAASLFSDCTIQRLHWHPKNSCNMKILSPLSSPPSHCTESVLRYEVKSENKVPYFIATK